jgi:hypothetical protein
MKTQADALRLLAALGATPWLIRHHELVTEAAEILCDGLSREVGPDFDRELVMLGAAIHDAGKIMHPVEMEAPGREHEVAGRQLLTDAGVDPAIARFCVTHAAWDAPEMALEDLLVALADKLWKGKRVDALEQLVVQRIAEQTQAEPWEVFDRTHRVFDAIAGDGPARLARSAV